MMLTDIVMYFGLEKAELALILKAEKEELEKQNAKSRV